MGAIDEAKAFRLETEFGSLGISKGNGSHGNERPLEGTRERGEPREQTVPEAAVGSFWNFRNWVSSHTRPEMGGQAGVRVDLWFFPERMS